MSKINFPKKQEQRLIPKYLLEYTEELQEYHPDPSASWGGGSGGSYTAGTGIDIENNVISVDNTVAMKTDIPDVSDFVTSTELSTELEDYELKSEAFSGSYSDLSNKPDLSVYELKTDAFTGDYDDLTNKPDLSVYELKTDAFSGDYNDLTNKPSIPTKTSDLINNSGFITGITSSDVTTALGYTPGTSNFSGDYDDLTDKPDLSIYELAADAFSGNYNDLTNKPTIPTKTSDLTNDSGFITNSALADYERKLTIIDISGTSGTLDATTLAGIIANPEAYAFRIDNDAGLLLVLANIRSTQLYYRNIYNYSAGNKLWGRRIVITLATGAWTFSTEYTNNLVSGTNDGTNWTSITIGDTTKTLPSGGSSYTAGTGIDITNNTISIDNTVALKSEIPTVPTNVSAFTNDAGYITSSALPDMTNYYTKTEINTNYYDRTDVDDIVDNVAADIPEIFANQPNPTTALTSLSINNTNYSIPTVPTNVSSFTNDAGYITNTVNNLTNYTLTSSLATVATSGNYNDLSNKPTIPTQRYKHTIIVARNDATAVFNITFSIIDTNSSDLTAAEIATFLANYNADTYYPIENAACYLVSSAAFRPVIGVYKYSGSDAVRAIIATGINTTTNSFTTSALNATTGVVKQITTAL